MDYKVDKESIKELFSIAGTVTNVELKKGEDNKSKGFGFVGKCILIVNKLKFCSIKKNKTPCLNF